MSSGGPKLALLLFIAFLGIITFIIHALSILLIAVMIFNCSVKTEQKNKARTITVLATAIFLGDVLSSILIVGTDVGLNGRMKRLSPIILACSIAFSALILISILLYRKWKTCKEKRLKRLLLEDVTAFEVEMDKPEDADETGTGTTTKTSTNSTSSSSSDDLPEKDLPQFINIVEPHSQSESSERSSRTEADKQSRMTEEDKESVMPSVMTEADKQYMMNEFDKRSIMQSAITDVDKQSRMTDAGNKRTRFAAAKKGREDENSRSSS